jgi:Zn-dependent membrane protease YugP
MVENLLFVAIIAVFILSVVAQSALNSKFNKYGKTQASARIPAFMAAQSMLTQNNSAATIAPVQGSLTDHYNPKTNVVGLSQTVYSDQSISALAVAAHEIGHVIQYQEGYTPIRIRNAILPVARLASNIAPWIVIAGLLLGMFNLAFIGAALFCAVLLFQLVTLPVEFNASSRALAMLRDGGFLTLEEMPKAKKVLRAAAFTYVVAAISSLVTLLRLIVLSRRTRRN